MSRDYVKATERSGVPVGLGLDIISAYCYGRRLAQAARSSFWPDKYISAGLFRPKLL